MMNWTTSARQRTMPAYPLASLWAATKTVSPFRVREFDAAFKHLHEFRTELFTHADLTQHLACLNLKEGPADGPAESDAGTLGVGNRRQRVSPYRRSRRTWPTACSRPAVNNGWGKGVFTGTAHSVKGLEFRVVLVLDGHWQLQRQVQLEEERRLFYVTMTRAQDCLVLFHRHDADNPHLRHIVGEACLHREGPRSGSYPLRGYATLGLPDLFLSFRGTEGPERPHP